jgi:hypothetical protein
MYAIEHTSPGSGASKSAGMPPRSSGVITTVRDDHHGVGRTFILSLRSLGGHGEVRLFTAWKMLSPLREQVERTRERLTRWAGEACEVVSVLRAVGRSKRPLP